MIVSLWSKLKALHGHPIIGFYQLVVAPDSTELLQFGKHVAVAKFVDTGFRVSLRVQFDDILILFQIDRNDRRGDKQTISIQFSWHPIEAIIKELGNSMLIASWKQRCKKERKP